MTDYPGGFIVCLERLLMEKIQKHNWDEEHHRNPERRVQMNYYIRNMETQKLELHFKKEDYLALPED